MLRNVRRRPHTQQIAPRRSTLFASAPLPAPLRAVPLAPVTRPANVEYRTARLTSAKTLSQEHLLAVAHQPRSPRSAGLDKRPPSWEAQCTLLCAAPLAGGHTRTPAVRPDDRGFASPPVDPSLARYARRAFGADDDGPLPRPGRRAGPLRPGRSRPAREGRPVRRPASSGNASTIRAGVRSGRYGPGLVQEVQHGPGHEVGLHESEVVSRPGDDPRPDPRRDTLESPHGGPGGVDLLASSAAAQSRLRETYGA